MEKHGFIYIWYDRKRKKYYLGSHWGTDNDGYICSSRIMRKAYKRRPHDFKRRIIDRIYTTRKDLLIREQHWLERVKRKDLYYNLCYVTHDGYWWTDPDKKLTVGQKISKANAGKKTRSREYKHSSETRQRMSEKRRGRKLTPQHREALLNSRVELSPESRKQISDKLMGHVHSDETKAKMSEKKKGKPWSEARRAAQKLKQQSHTGIL